MCVVSGCAKRPGGGRYAASFTKLCDRHRQNDRRHGHPLQHPIRATHLKPFIRTLKARQVTRSEAPAWAALEARWATLVMACRDMLSIYAAEGQPMSRWTVEAAGEIVKVADEATATEAWKTAVAMFLLRDANPRLFPTEQAFKVQLGRRVRHLATTSRASYWNPASGTMKTVYRDPSPRAAVEVGMMLLETFGVAGHYFAKQLAAEKDATVREREAFHAALLDVAPGVA